MKKVFCLKKYLLIVISLMCFFICHKLNISFKKPDPYVSREDSALNVNYSFLHIFSMGQKRMISGLLWIHTLMTSDIEHYKKKSLNSWMYLRFKTIASLTPRFYKNYLFGGQYLSVIKDDIKGASDIYDRGLKIFMDDFWLNFYGAAHYYFEENDVNKAIYHYEKIKDHEIAHKRMPFIRSLLARIKFVNRNKESAYKLMKATWENTPDHSPIKKKLYTNLYSMRAQIDLACLNNRKESNCRTVDLNGTPYILTKEKVYKAPHDWTPINLFRRKKK